MRKLTKIEKKIKKLTKELNELKKLRIRLKNKHEPQLFKLRYELEVELWSCDIWPDGDEPPNPSIDDVWEVINFDSDVISILKDWNLLDDNNSFLTITHEKRKIQI